MTDAKPNSEQPETPAPPEGSAGGSGSGVTIPGYQPVEALGGAPSFGIWVRAIQTRMDRHVLLKLLPQGSPVLSDYFAREISSLVRLDGRGSLRVIDEGTAGGVRYLVSDEASSESLIETQLSDTAWIEFGRTVEALTKELNDRDLVLLPIPARAFRSLPAGDFKTADLGWLVPVGEKLPEHKRIPTELRGTLAQRWMNALFLGQTLSDVVAESKGDPPKAFRNIVADLQSTELDADKPDPLATPVFEDAVVAHHNYAMLIGIGVLVLAAVIAAIVFLSSKIFVDGPPPDECADLIAEAVPSYIGTDWVLATALREEFGVDDVCFDRLVAALRSEGIEVREVDPSAGYKPPRVYANEVAALEAFDAIMGPLDEEEEEPEPWLLMNQKRVPLLEAFVARTDFAYDDGRLVTTPAQVAAQRLAERWRWAQESSEWTSWSGARRDILAQLERSPSKAEMRLDEYDRIAGSSTRDDRVRVRTAIMEQSRAIEAAMNSEVEKLCFEDQYDDAKKRIREVNEDLDRAGKKRAEELLVSIEQEQERLRGVLEAMRAALKVALRDGVRGEFAAAKKKLESTLPPEEFARQRQRAQRWLARFEKAQELQARFDRALKKVAKDSRPYLAIGAEEVRGTVKSVAPTGFLVKVTGRRQEVNFSYRELELASIQGLFTDSSVLPPTEEELALLFCLLGDGERGLSLARKSSPEWLADMERVHEEKRTQQLVEQMASGRKLAKDARWGEARGVVLYLAKRYTKKELNEYRGEFQQWLTGYWGQDASAAFPGATSAQAELEGDGWLITELFYDFTKRSEDRPPPHVDWRGPRGAKGTRRTDCVEVKNAIRLVPDGNRDVFVDQIAVEVNMQARLTPTDIKKQQGANLGIVLWSTNRPNSGALFALGWRHSRVRSLERDGEVLSFPGNIIADLSKLAGHDASGIYAYRLKPKVEAKGRTGLTSKFRVTAESDAQRSVLRWKPSPGKLTAAADGEPWVYPQRKGTVEIHTESTLVRVYSVRITGAKLNPDWWNAWLAKKVASEMPR